MISTLIIFQELGTLVQTNENDIEEKVQSISANLTVRKAEKLFCYYGKQL